MLVKYHIQHLLTKADEYKSRGKDTDRFKAAAYSAAAKLLSNKLSVNIHLKKSDLDSLALTERMRNIILQYDETPLTIYSMLLAIPGIGPSKAQELIKAGVEKLSDLSSKSSLLHDDTLLYLKYKPLTQIPRNISDNFNNILKKLNFTTTIVGSYRRGLSFSRDLDVMLVSDKPVLTEFINELSKVLPLVVYSQGDAKASLIITKRPTFKVDIFQTDKLHATSMLLYSTGSRELNVKMRAIAKKNGYLLNQQGLFKGKMRLPLRTERDYFTALNLPYLPPSKR